MHFLTRHHKLFLLLSLVVAIGFGSFAPFVQTVNNVDYFTLKDNPDYTFYEQFKDEFGNDEFFVIAFEKEDIFTTKNLRLIKDITSRLESSDLVRDVVSLSNVDYISGDQNYFSVGPFLEQIPNSRAECTTLREKALHNPLYVRNLISKDGTTTAIVVFAYDRPQDPNYRQELLAATHKILMTSQGSTSFHLAGWTVTNYQLSQYMQRDLATFIPLTYLLIAAVIFFFFRSIRLTGLAVLTITACMGSTMGLFRILGIPINNVTTIVPPLVMALALGDVVHIFSHLQRSVLERFPDPRDALAFVLNQVRVPCFLTTLTTACGFLSLAVSDLEPIRQFAYLASAGMVFEFFFAFTLLPCVLLSLDPVKIYAADNESSTMSHFLGTLNSFVQQSTRTALTVAGLFVVVAVFFAIQLRVETNLVDFFRSSTPVYHDLSFVEQRLSGVGSLDISLQAKTQDAFKDPQNLHLVDKLERYVHTLHGVDTTTSFNYFMKEMNKAFHDEDEQYYRIPQSRQLISQFLLLYGSDDINDFINRRYDHTRIMIRLGVHSSSEQARIIERIRNYVYTLHALDMTIRVTGHALQDVDTIHALVWGQVKSLGLAVLTISLIMCLALKSWRLGLLSLVPNGFPIVLNFGIMGLLGIPLSTATSLIAAVALGIAVDDTIHFMSFYAGQRKMEIQPVQAVQKTMLMKGTALVSSSVILCIGFGVLVLSRFMPVVHFGLLSAIIMLTALMADLIVAPALLLIRAPRDSTY